MRRLSLLLFTLLFVFGAWSQEKVKDLPKEVPTNIQKPMKVESQEYIPLKQLYVVKNPKKLMTYFKSGEIPADFPKYDHDKTKEENVKIAVNWAKTGNNMSLLTEEAIKKMKSEGLL